MKTTGLLAVFILAATAAVNSGALAVDGSPAPAGKTRAERMGIPASGHYTSFRELDSNRDGNVTREEAKDSPVVARRFQELDRDGDGRISPAEQNGWSFYGPPRTRQ